MFFDRILPNEDQDPSKNSNFNAPYLADIKTYSPFYDQKKHFWAELTACSIQHYDRLWISLGYDDIPLHPPLENILDYHGDYDFMMKFPRDELLLRNPKYWGLRHEMDSYFRYNAYKNETIFLCNLAFSSSTYKENRTGFTYYPAIKFVACSEQNDYAYFLRNRFFYQLSLASSALNTYDYLQNLESPFASNRKNLLFYRSHSNYLNAYTIPQKKVLWSAPLKKEFDEPSFQEMLDWNAKTYHTEAYYRILAPYFTDYWFLFQAGNRFGIYSTNKGKELLNFSLETYMDTKDLYIFPPMVFKNSLMILYIQKKEWEQTMDKVGIIELRGKDKPIIKHYQLGSFVDASSFELNKIAFFPNSDGFWLKISRDESDYSKLERIIYYELP